MKLGTTIREIRFYLGLSQAELARQLGISTVFMNRVENSRAQLSPEMLHRINKFFGIDIYVLAWCNQTKHKGIAMDIREKFYTKLDERLNNKRDNNQ